MRLHSALSVNERTYPAGSEVPWYYIYPFFLVHMLGFGVPAFLMAYSSHPASVKMLYVFGGFSIAIYTVFYLVIFGRDEIKWMFINAALGLFGIYSQIGWLLSFFGKNIGDYPVYVHAIPFLYFVLYTFLIRHAILDITQSREDDNRKKRTEYGYIAVSVAIYIISYCLERR